LQIFRLEIAKPGQSLKNMAQNSNTTSGIYLVKLVNLYVSKLKLYLATNYTKIIITIQKFHTLKNV
jgi:hypothetical protein